MNEKDELLKELSELDALIEGDDKKKKNEFENKVDSNTVNEVKIDAELKSVDESNQKKNISNEESKENKELIVELLKESDKYYKNHDITKAIIKYQEVLQLDKNNLIALFNLGCIYMEREETDKAIEKFEEVLKIEPNDYRSLCNLGGLYYENGRYKEAISILERALRINPNDINSANNYEMIKEIVKRKEKRKIFV